ncbi:MAG: tetratricopeptide repeat protein [Methanotrichaceae archaeon]|jgi:tetratricopeptide (TPR) repeat protein
MPAPKSSKSLLTAIEKERLSDKNIDPIIRKRNDMIVRNKLMAWLGSVNDILFALEHLRVRKLKKELDDSYIYGLLEIVREIIDLKDFCKLHDIGKEVIAVKQIVEHHNPDFTSAPKAHQATNIDFDRIFKLETALEEIRSLLPEINECAAFEKYKEAQLELISEVIAKSSVDGKLPSEADFWNRKGCDLLFGNPRAAYPKSTEHIEKSLNCFNKALENEPNHIDALMNKSYALGELGEYKEAIKCIDKVLAIDASDSEIWRLRAIYNQFVENYEESLMSLDKAIQINPMDTPAKIMKIDILKSVGRESEAEDLISQYFKKDKKLRELKGWTKATTKSSNLDKS